MKSGSSQAINFRNYIVILLLGFTVGTFSIFELNLMFFGRPFDPRENGPSKRYLQAKQSEKLSNSSFKPVNVICILRIKGGDVGDLNKLNVSLNAWAFRCSHHVIVSETSDEKLPFKPRGGADLFLEKKMTEWERTREILRFLDNKFKEEDGSFLTLFLITHVKDKTYISVENLEAFVERVFAGAEWKPFILSHMLIEDGFPYPSPKPALVLNKPAVRGFVNRMDYGDGHCKLKTWEDNAVTFTRCLVHIGANFIDARDQFGRLLFLPNNLHPLVTSNATEMLKVGGTPVNPIPTGMGCCSDRPIAFAHNQLHPNTLQFFIHRFYLAGQGSPVRLGIPFMSSTSNSSNPGIPKRR